MYRTLINSHRPVVMSNKYRRIAYVCRRNSNKTVLVSCKWAETVVVMSWYSRANILTKNSANNSGLSVPIGSEFNSPFIASNVVTVRQGLNGCNFLHKTVSSVDVKLGLHYIQLLET